MLCPATKLWNTGHGANMMREAVSLMGGYGITEDCPGFLANKWMDAQLEATYEGPEAVQRRQLTVTMTSEVFLAQFRAWTAQMRRIASTHPGTGACTLASAMQLWHWTLNHLQNATDPDGDKLYHGQRQGVTFALADALCWLLASRCQILDVLELEARGRSDPVAAEGLAGTVQFLSDLCHTQAAQAAGEVSAHLRRARLRLQPPSRLGRGGAQQLLPRQRTRRLRRNHARHLRLCRRCPRRRWHSSVKRPAPAPVAPATASSFACKASSPPASAAARLAKDRAADTVSKVMIPEALDYPA